MVPARYFMKYHLFWSKQKEPSCAFSDNWCSCWLEGERVTATWLCLGIDVAEYLELTH